MTISQHHNRLHVGAARYSRKLHCVMSVTDKSSKAVTLIAGRLIATSGKVWVTTLLNHLSLLPWGLPGASLSDRN